MSIRLQSFIFLVVNSILTVVETLPSNHVLVRDGSSTILPETEPWSESSDWALQDSEISTSGDNLYSPEVSPDILDLASTQQLATDINPFDQDYLFYDFGPPAESSILKNTIGLIDIGYNQPDLVSLGGSSQDHLDESSFSLTFGPSDIFAFEEGVLSGDNTIPDTAHPTDDTSYSDEHTSLFGEASSFLDEDNSVLSSVSSTDINPFSEDMSLSEEGASFPTEGLFDIDGSQTDSWGTEELLNTYGSYQDDSRDTEGLLASEGSLMPIGEKARAKGTTETPTCPTGKIPACCLSTVPELTNILKNQCVSYQQNPGQWCPYQGRFCCIGVHDNVGLNCEPASSPESEFSLFGDSWFIPALLRTLKTAPVFP